MKLLLYLLYYIREFEIQNINIYEIEKNINNNIQLIVCSNEIVHILNYNEKDCSFKNNIDIKKVRFYCRTKNNDLICNEQGVFHLKNISSILMNPKEYQIIDKSFWGGIQINENLFAFTSNKILLNGENKMIFYNLISRKIINIINN